MGGVSGIEDVYDTGGIGDVHSVDGIVRVDGIGDIGGIDKWYRKFTLYKRYTRGRWYRWKVNTGIVDGIHGTKGVKGMGNIEVGHGIDR